MSVVSEPKQHENVIDASQRNPKIWEKRTNDAKRGTLSVISGIYETRKSYLITVIQPYKEMKL